MKLFSLILGHRWRFLLTLLLVLLDAGLLVLFPLFIGYAIDDAVNSEYAGAIYLGLLGLATLFVGAARRFFDSRFYGRIYEQLGAQIGDRKELAVSTKSAHLGFLTEVVEFFENALPELINQTIGLVGTLVIIGSLDLTLLAGCFIVLSISLVVYGLSSQRTLYFNREYNKELENQVEVIKDHQPVLVRRHLHRLMRWNIRLSDLETVNFSVVWLFMMAFLVGSIVFAIKQRMESHGTVFALVLYLFQFVESTLVMPVFFQQGLRLKGIMDRLGSL